MPSRKHSQIPKGRSLVEHQRHSKTHRTRAKALSERSKWCQEAFDHKQDAGRADDKSLAQEIKAAREDNAPAESLSDLSM
ncbi:hypothetical protein OCU04_005132 [Sclerotinia nivalis]|uniref:Uncharacterized protein n=1 Tax=Sclerotinia nivalis TaxID=352851 RepID=A0A9X0APA7_9HELO|nr:hypothetical protein OCU04_005132 [Sclerotinia nivalis]